MQNPLATNGKISEKSLVGYGLVGWGLIQPSQTSGSPISYVWILSSNVTPQPYYVRSIWTTDGVWECGNVWYR